MTARTALIRQRLEQELKPDRLEVIDESHLHAGHAGARDGRGHFRIYIVSAHFTGQSRIARHRLVHAALDDLLRTDIHALSLTTAAPDEINSR